MTSVKTPSSINRRWAMTAFAIFLAVLQFFACVSDPLPVKPAVSRFDGSWKRFAADGDTVAWYKLVAGDRIETYLGVRGLLMKWAVEDSGSRRFTSIGTGDTISFGSERYADGAAFRYIRDGSWTSKSVCADLALGRGILVKEADTSDRILEYGDSLAFRVGEGADSGIAEPARHAIAVYARIDGGTKKLVSLSMSRPAEKSKWD